MQVVVALVLVLLLCIAKGDVGDSAAEPAAGCNDVRTRRGFTTGQGVFYVRYDAVTVAPVLCDFDVFPGRAATLLNKLSGGTTNVNDDGGVLWTQAWLNYNRADILHMNKSTVNYASRSHDAGYWSLVKQASVRVYTGAVMQKYVDFKIPAGSDTVSWFSQANLIGSSWGNINVGSGTGAYFAFSVYGNGHNRYWYINSLYNNCPGDRGYLGVFVNGLDVCTSTLFPASRKVPGGNVILYSPNSGDSLIASNLIADVLAVWADMDNFDYSGPGWTTTNPAPSCTQVMNSINNKAPGNFYVKLNQSLTELMYCDFTTFTGKGAALFWKYSGAVTPQTNAYNLWINGAVGGDTERNVRNTTTHYSHPDMKTWFTSKRITQASMRIYTNEIMQRYINFNVLPTSDNLNWFAAANWNSSSWTKPSSFNFFSINGDPANGRSWQITTLYNLCPGDAGLLTLPTAATDGCRPGAYAGGWFQATYPYIPPSYIYYAPGSAASLVGGTFAFADALTIFVDITPDASLYPSISGVNPAIPLAGSSMTITGSNFLATQGSITFAGAAMTVVSWTDTQIVVTAPMVTLSANLIIRSAYGLDSNSFSIGITVSYCQHAGCPPHTSCNETNKSCDCLPQFTGSNCMSCSPNLYPYGSCNIYCDNQTCNGRGKCNQYGQCCNSPYIKLYIAEQNDCTGYFRISVVGGVGPYTYLLNEQEVASNEVTGLNPGTYTFKVIDANLECQSATVQIILPLPENSVIVNTVSVSTPFCGEGSGSISNYTASNGKNLYNLLVNKNPYTLGAPLDMGSYELSLAGVNSCIVSNGKIRLPIVTISCYTRN